MRWPGNEDRSTETYFTKKKEILLLGSIENIRTRLVRLLKLYRGLILNINNQNIRDTWGHFVSFLDPCAEKCAHVWGEGTFLKHFLIKVLTISGNYKLFLIYKKIPEKSPADLKS